ncbi:Ig-like domain-containing protein [Duffyella gerundensis]|uniref:Ig-like domain-containing protein n=1 Tax=Duffyella gerundensis TaxID=1619313 RepID=UPI0021F7084B|nr:Ig-like domain-containing protein [Duffyella gerundensis]
MSDFPWDPTSGNADYTSSPYQYWAGSEPKEAGGKVEFVINNMLYTTNIEADGSWTFQLPVMLMDGQHNLSVRYIDRAMNYGPPYLSTIHVDTTPPAKPIIQTVLDDVGDAMPLSNGQITDDTKPRFSGSAEPQSIVRLFDKNTGALLGSTVANANGYWSIEEELGYGQHEVFVTSSDRHNHVSEPSESWVVNINDPNAPPASDPYITGGADNVGTAQGELAFGAVTDDNRPMLKGMAEPDSVVYVFAANAAGQWLIVASSRAEADGRWSVETAQLNAGTYDFQVSSSATRNPNADIFRLTIADAGSSALKPVIVDIMDDAGTATGALVNGAITDDRTPTLRGTAEANSIVYIHYGRSGVSWEPTASVQANAKGEWTFTPNLYQDYTWDFYASTSSNRDDVETVFQLELKSGNALKPVIIDAYDDFGIRTGELINGASTDDRTPTLRGTAEANSIVYIHYGRSGVSWEPTASVQANAKGEWSFTPNLYQDYTWDFYASTSSNRDDVETVFQLELKSGNALKPVIIDAYDDFGIRTGELVNGASTDDRTPTLRGTAEANSIVYIHYGRLSVAFEPLASVKANAKGEWSFTPQLNHAHKWDFFVSNTSAGFDYSTSFQLDIKSDSAAEPVITAIWDNEGSLRELADGDFTNDRTPEIRGTGEPNSKIIVVLAKGQEGWENNNRSVETWADENGNWKVTIPAPELTDDRWHFRVKSVDAAGNEGELRSQMYIEVRDNLIESRTVWDFNDGTLQGWSAAGKYAKENEMAVKSYGSGIGVNSHTDDKTESGYDGDIIYRDITVVAGQVYHFEFEAFRANDKHQAPKLGMKVDGQTVIPETPITESWIHLSGTYVATESKTVRVAVTNGEKSGNGNDFWFDNVVIEPEINRVDSEQPTLLMADALAGTVQKGADLTGHGSTMLKVTAGDVLAFGEKDLFIADGKTQLMINGDASDVVNLDDLLGDGRNNGDWSQLSGTITVGGLEYSVWQHSSEDAELLIQSGVQTQLI